MARWPIRSPSRARAFVQRFKHKAAGQPEAYCARLLPLPSPASWQLSDWLTNGDRRVECATRVT